MARRNQAELHAYARDALRILRRSIALYDGGEKEFYRVMAVELRLLLCDTTRRHDQLYDLSLAPRLWPDLVLPPLDGSGPPLLLETWLAQEVQIAPGRVDTFRQVIRQVCEQDGGAHVDRRLHTGLPPEADAAGWIRALTGAVVQALEPLFPRE